MEFLMVVGISTLLVLVIVLIKRFFKLNQSVEESSDKEDYLDRIVKKDDEE